MDVTQDAVVDISEALERFFGCSGKMLKPSRATVEALVRSIPENQILTTDLLRAELARRSQVQVTCPYCAKQALKAIGKAAPDGAPFWRVVKANGELISYFPGGVEGHAALLKDEGFVIDDRPKTPRVQGFKDHLVRLE
ncbi:hypothetical protein CCAX7_57230 [Capsulimonas corticalis]|uniref:Uncharacterized protein n=1 Tax=Capsulimonas corticalis TaxID=2219043 RepID=A0A402D098_9BACT|nr:MGMT family protein [Capsulimonas corticalis]BDI33672.1 hypothetical protein CCAX7_57230 [Capsulimonas corticalis]